MNTKRYSNFTEFFNDFKEEFLRTQNQRLFALFNTIATLSQGCGCTRRYRTGKCSEEYRNLPQYIAPENVQVMQMKFPNTKFELAEGDEVFHVIDV
tara:strand:- start:338 stop:625 length:288 start_codon:yes stop_codon:yes gene_type:complete